MTQRSEGMVIGVGDAQRRRERPCHQGAPSIPFMPWPTGSESGRCRKNGFKASSQEPDADCAPLAPKNGTLARSTNFRF